MARRAWTAIAAGTAIYWGWLIAASAIFGEDEPSTAVPLALTMLPLVAGAGLTVAAGVAGARDPRGGRSGSRSGWRSRPACWSS